MRLDATGWIEHLELVEFLATSGCLLGLLIGKSRWSAGMARMLLLGYSLVILPWQLSLAAPLEDKYAVRLANVMQRLYTTLSQFAANQRLEDPIFFLACISFLYWSFSLMAGYQLARYGRPWYPIIGASIVLVMIEFYHKAGAATSSWTTGMFALCLLLLVARLYYVRLRRGWDGKNLSVDAETGRGLGKGALIMSVVIVLAAWNLPLLSPTILKEVLSSSPTALTPADWQDRLSKIVAALKVPPDAEGNNYNTYLALGREASSGDDLIFSATVFDSAAPGARLYWQARSYDFYDNGSWINTQEQAVDLKADEQRFASSVRTGRSPVTVGIMLNATQIRNVFVAGEPLTINRPVRVLGEVSTAGVEDVTAILPTTTLDNGETYQVRSLIPSPSRQQMRATSQDYPAWVKGRYLQVPAGMTQRTRDLAAEITAGLTTPYDKAEAITSWLRQNITYSATIPDPPAGREVTDWFLFDQKSGYCNYYATAEVLMLRSLGVPTRLAAGYAQGEMDERVGAYRILRKDSHAWPEVYFPGLGWVEFEPTASQPELVYPDVDPSLSLPNEGGINSREGLDTVNGVDGMEQTPEAPTPEEQPSLASTLTAFWESYRQWILGLAAFLLIGLIVYLVHRICKKYRITFPALIARFLIRVGWSVPVWLNSLDTYLGLSDISRSFLWVPVYIRFLGGSVAVGATPSERMRALNSAEPATSFYGNLLLREYEKDIFSSRAADLEVGREAARGLAVQVVKSWWQKLIRW